MKCLEENGDFSVLRRPLASCCDPLSAQLVQPSLFSFGTNALLGMSLFEEEREAEAAPGGGTDWTRPPQAPPLASALLSFLSVFFSIVYR